MQGSGSEGDMQAVFELLARSVMGDIRRCPSKSDVYPSALLAGQFGGMTLPSALAFAAAATAGGLLWGQRGGVMAHADAAAEGTPSISPEETSRVIVISLPGGSKVEREPMPFPLSTQASPARHPPAAHPFIPSLPIHPTHVIPRCPPPAAGRSRWSLPQTAPAGRSR